MDLAPEFCSSRKVVVLLQEEDKRYVVIPAAPVGFASASFPSSTTYCLLLMKSSKVTVTVFPLEVAPGAVLKLSLPVILLANPPRFVPTERD